MKYDMIYLRIEYTSVREWQYICALHNVDVILHEPNTWETLPRSAYVKALKTWTIVEIHENTLNHLLVNF